eukprot:TRINITY_DN10407_c0_g1_i1.p1 TRINITY_DN10407_c0_g1~~TRINITY_DN10407_c0_g1_i1.p1  ORF type:complete len:139 (+),score=24.68 TRINITY_DN10407_c0_g1_i1:44-460(+)
MLKTAFFLLSVTVAAQADDKEAFEYDPSQCPNQEAAAMASLCIEQELDWDVKAFHALSYLTRYGNPQEIPKKDALQLCGSINKYSVDIMRKCKVKHGCSNVLKCSLRDFKNLLAIGCKKNTASLLCEQIFDDGEDAEL